MEARPMAGFLFYKWKPARGGGLVVLYESPPEGAGLIFDKWKPVPSGELVMQNDNVERRDCLVLR